MAPGKPEESPLYEMVHDGSMPADKKGRLGEAEVDTLRRWIEAGAGAGYAGALDRPPEVTQHDVIPILLRRCTVCHGLRQQEGGLDLRTRASMLKGGKSGPAFVPGKPDESLILRKIRDGSMPPRRRLVEVSVKPIEAAETDLLARWIDAGRRKPRSSRTSRATLPTRSSPTRTATSGPSDAQAGRGPHRSGTPRGSATRSMPSSSRSSSRRASASRPRRIA